MAEQLFDYWQIMEATIYKASWMLLIYRYGYELLCEINKRNGWLDCDDLEEYKMSY